MDQQDFNFMKTFVAIMALLGASAVVFYFLANSMSDTTGAVEPGSPEFRALEERIAPVGSVVISGDEADTPAPAAAVAAPQDGASIVTASCAACHATGVMAAPRIGSKDDWNARLAASDFAGLVKTAIDGKGAMPARGGNAALSDDAIRMAVAHMLKESGIEVDAADAGGESAAAGTEPAAAEPVADGKAVYTKACFACHGTGAAGAPKVGDAADWGARNEQGMAILVKHAIDGFTGSKGLMPPKGGHPYLSDAEIESAIVYMVEQSQ